MCKTVVAYTQSYRLQLKLNSVKHGNCPEWNLISILVKSNLETLKLCENIWYSSPHNTRAVYYISKKYYTIGSFSNLRINTISSTTIDGLCVSISNTPLNTCKPEDEHTVTNMTPQDRQISVSSRECMAKTFLKLCPVIAYNY